MKFTGEGVGNPILRVHLVLNIKIVFEQFDQPFLLSFFRNPLV